MKGFPVESPMFEFSRGLSMGTWRNPEGKWEHHGRIRWFLSIEGMNLSSTYQGGELDGRMVLFLWIKTWTIDGFASSTIKRLAAPASAARSCDKSGAPRHFTEISWEY